MDRLCDAAVSEMLHYFLIGIFGAMGAVSRSSALQWLNSSTYPLGTLLRQLAWLCITRYNDGRWAAQQLNTRTLANLIAAGFWVPHYILYILPLKISRLLEAQQWKLFLLHFILQAPCFASSSQRVDCTAAVYYSAEPEKE